MSGTLHPIKPMGKLRGLPHPQTLAGIERVRLFDSSDGAVDQVRCAVPFWIEHRPVLSAI
jgi:hypothetical protein